MTKGPLPRVYALLDAQAIGRRGLTVAEVAHAFRAAGVTLLQFRDKVHDSPRILADAAVIKATFAGSGCRLLLNDSPRLAVEAGWDGVHVGQGDASVEQARLIVGAGRWVGVSTHTDDQVRAAARSSADYVAIGPVFPTPTKEDAEVEVGLKGVVAARRLTAKPLVAIGGITSGNARSVLEAGADSVAIVSALLGGGGSVRAVVEALLRQVG